LQGFLILAQFLQSQGLLEIIEVVLWLNFTRFLKAFHCLLEVLHVLVVFGHVRQQSGRIGVDLSSIAEEVEGGVVPLLHLSNVSLPEPGCVVPFVHLQGILVALLRLIKVFVFDVLMTSQGVRIKEEGIDLSCSCEIL